MEGRRGRVGDEDDLHVQLQRSAREVEDLLREPWKLSHEDRAMLRGLLQELMEALDPAPLASGALVTREGRQS